MKKTILCSALLLVSGYAQAEDIPKVPDVKSNQPAQATSTPNTSTAPKPIVIDCHHKIPQDTKKIEDFIIKTWTAKAVVQSFDFKPDNIDAQLEQLKACFTDAGWEGFNTALKKSGNLEAIKSQKLSVTCQINGQIDLKEVKENQWNVTFPMNVVYNNEKEKVTQSLQINVNVGRKVSGELGINSLVATTKPENQPQAAAPQTTSQTPGETTPQKN